MSAKSVNGCYQADVWPRHTIHIHVNLSVEVAFLGSRALALTHATTPIEPTKANEYTEVAVNHSVVADMVVGCEATVGRERTSPRHERVSAQTATLSRASCNAARRTPLDHCTGPRPYCNRCLFKTHRTGKDIIFCREYIYRRADP